MTGAIGKSVRSLQNGGVTLLAAHTFRYTGERLLVRAATRAFRERLRRVEGLEDAVELAFGFEFEGLRIAPFQVRSELDRLVREVADLRPQTVLDLGTAQGGTLFLFAQAAAPDALLVSVDLPGGRFGGGYPPPRERLYREFAREGQRLELVRGDSHAPETLERVRHLLGGRDVDFLFVDADHMYEGVRRDYEMYSPLVRAGGLTAFHDVVPGPVDLVGGVPRFWSELKASREVHEIVDDWEQGAYGIGLLEKQEAGA